MHKVKPISSTASQKLDEWVRSLPTGHLRLTTRARRTVGKYPSIGDLRDEINLRNADAQWPKSVATEVSTVLEELFTCLHELKEAGCLKPCKSRPQTEYNSVYFASPAFDRLSEESKALPLDRLHFSQRALNCLVRVNITSLRELLAAAERGIVRLRLAGKAITGEIHQSLWAIASSVGSFGEIDWITYSKARGFELLPQEISSGSLNAFLVDFPSLCERAILGRFGAKAVLIFRKRLLRPFGNFESFRDIADQIGSNRETIRLIEGQIVSMLEGAILRASYTGCSFRFRDEFLNPFIRLANAIPREANNPISKVRWNEVLDKAWKVSREEVQAQEVLLLRLLGFQTFTAEHATVAPGDDRRWRRSGEAVAELNKFLRKRGAKWVTRQEVWQQLAKAKLIVHSSDVDQLISLIETAEGDAKQQRFRIRFESLPNNVEKCDRLLREHGGPLHYRRLATLIAERRGHTQEDGFGRAILNTLSGSPRFCPIGRTGEWILSEWQHIERRQIVDIAAELLEQSQRPLTSRSLFEAIATRRRIRPSSISTLLRKDSRFLKIAPETWTLRTR